MKYIIELSTKHSPDAAWAFQAVADELDKYDRGGARLIEETRDPDDPDHHAQRRVIAAFNYGEE